MSAATARKQGTPQRDVNARTSSSPSAANRTPAKSSTSTPTTNGASGVSRTRSVRSSVNNAPTSARAAVKKPAATSNLRTASPVDDDDDDDVRDAQAVLLQDLKDRLQKAETEAEERQKIIGVLNAKLDDALSEQAKLEERAHEEEEKVEALENMKRELTRQHRELEGIYEAEQSKVLKEKEETQTREEELQETIHRLKDTLASKNLHTDDEEPQISRTCKSSSMLIKMSLSSINTDHLQRVSATSPPAQIPRRTSRTSHRLRPSSAAIRETTQSSLTRRTRSSKTCASN
jgi:myosin heavy subunit